MTRQTPWCGRLTRSAVNEALRVGKEVVPRWAAWERMDLTGRLSLLGRDRRFLLQITRFGVGREYHGMLCGQDVAIPTVNLDDHSRGSRHAGGGT